MIIPNTIDIIGILTANGQFWTYAILFVLMFLEGPIITYLAAFAASLNYLSLPIIISISVLGNQIPDIIFYAVGRFVRGPVIERVCYFFGLNRKRMRWLEKGIKEHALKTTVLIKFIAPISVPGIVLSGFLRMPFWKFFWVNLGINTILATIFSFLGYYSGVTVQTIMKYLRLTSEYLAIALAIAIILYFVLKNRYAKKTHIPKIKNYFAKQICKK